MTKSEWAGWAQAVFSVIAIAVAAAIPIGLSIRDSRERRKMEIGSAWVTGMEIFGLTRSMINRLRDIIDHYKDISDKNMRVGQIKILHEAFSGAEQPSEEQLLRLVAANERFVAFIMSGFSKIRRVYLYLDYLIAYEEQIDVKIGDSAMRHIISELKESKIALEFGIDELIDFLNSKTAYAAGIDGGEFPEIESTNKTGE